MQTIYESESIKIVESIKILESIDDDGEVQRQLLLGPPFQNAQGVIKTNRPKFHVRNSAAISLTGRFAFRAG
jgi:hypothetical protein